MDKLCLIPPGAAYTEQIAAFRQEFLDADSHADGCGPLRKMEDIGAWLKQVDDLSHPDTLPEGRVLSSQFLCVRKADGYLVGMIQIRHYFNDHLAEYGGHIGYSVRPSQRRKGYAKQMLALALPCCKSLGIDRVLITCEPANEGSRRTILANGGVYERTVFEPEENISLERYWIQL